MLGSGAGSRRLPNLAGWARKMGGVAAECGVEMEKAEVVERDMGGFQMVVVSVVVVGAVRKTRLQTPAAARAEEQIRWAGESHLGHLGREEEIGN